VDFIFIKLSFIAKSGSKNTQHLSNIFSEIVCFW